jgi:hypothetical protein
MFRSLDFWGLLGITGSSLTGFEEIEQMKIRGQKAEMLGPILFVIA